MEKIAWKHIVFIRNSATSKYYLISSSVRSTYKDALYRLQGDNPLIAPQFKTWLYVYRNNSIVEEFRHRLRDDYYVEVKEIDRLDWSDVDSAEEFVTESAVAPSTESSGTLSEIELSQKAASQKPVESENSKDIPDFETLKLQNPEDETRLIETNEAADNADQKDASKFDEVVDDKQYVEVPVILEEISKDKLVQKAKMEIIADNNQYVPESVVTSEGIKAVKQEIRETILERSNKDESNMEILDAQESAFSARKVQTSTFNIPFQILNVFKKKKKHLFLL